MACPCGSAPWAKIERCCRNYFLKRVSVSIGGGGEDHFAIRLPPYPASSAPSGADGSDDAFYGLRGGRLCRRAAPPAAVAWGSVEALSAGEEGGGESGDSRSIGVRQART